MRRCVMKIKSRFTLVGLLLVLVATIGLLYQNVNATISDSDTIYFFKDSSNEYNVYFDYSELGLNQNDSYSIEFRDCLDHSYETEFSFVPQINTDYWTFVDSDDFYLWLDNIPNHEVEYRIYNYNHTSVVINWTTVELCELTSELGELSTSDIGYEISCFISVPELFESESLATITITDSSDDLLIYSEQTVSNENSDLAIEIDDSILSELIPGVSYNMYITWSIDDCFGKAHFCSAYYVLTRTFDVDIYIDSQAYEEGIINIQNGCSYNINLDYNCPGAHDINLVAIDDITGSCVGRISTMTDSSMTSFVFTANNAYVGHTITFNLTVNSIDINNNVAVLTESFAGIVIPSIDADIILSSNHPQTPQAAFCGDIITTSIIGNSLVSISAEYESDIEAVYSLQSESAVASAEEDLRQAENELASAQSAFESNPDNAELQSAYEQAQSNYDSCYSIYIAATAASGLDWTATGTGYNYSFTVGNINAMHPLDFSISICDGTYTDFYDENSIVSGIDMFDSFSVNTSISSNELYCIDDSKNQFDSYYYINCDDVLRIPIIGTTSNRIIELDSSYSYMSLVNSGSSCYLQVAVADLIEHDLNPVNFDVYIHECINGVNQASIPVNVDISLNHIYLAPLDSNNLSAVITSIYGDDNAVCDGTPISFAVNGDFEGYTWELSVLDCYNAGEVYLDSNSFDTEILYTIPEYYNNPFWDNQTLEFIIHIVDKSGQEINLPVQQVLVYFSPITLSAVIDVDAGENPFLCSTSIINLSANQSGHAVNITNVYVDAEGSQGDMVAVSFSDNSTTTVVCSDLLLENNECLALWVGVEDASGQTAVIRQEISSYTFYLPIEECISNVFISTTNNDSSYVKEGDTITISFTSSHVLSVNNDNDEWLLNGYIGGYEVAFISSDGLFWSGTFIIPDNCNWNDNTTITFEVELYDRSDNSNFSIDETMLDGTVTYYSPIVLQNISFVSSNSEGNVANDTNIVTVSFEFSHPLIMNNSVIGGIPVRFSEQIIDGVYYYEASAAVSNMTMEDNSEISFNYIAEDSAGNNAVFIDQTSCSAVIYQAPIFVSNASVISDNSMNAEYAINGNELTVTFTTTHPVEISSASVANDSISLSSVDNQGMVWTGTYTIPNEIVSDQSSIPVSIELHDISGNTPFVYENSNIIYFAPLVISDVVVYTNNSNDGRLYAIDGNSVTVAFISNHAIDVNNSTFSLFGIGLSGNVTETVNSSGRYLYSFSSVVANGYMNDLDVVPFEFTVTDYACNQNVQYNALSSGVSNTITYYAPLSVNVSIASNGDNMLYAGNGDTIIVSSFANHNVSLINASWSDRNMSINGNNSTNITAFYTIDENESLLAEGVVTFDLVYVDVAGNSISVSNPDSGSVIYDRTSPVINIGNAYSGFSNEGIEFNISISDANIDRNNTIVRINDSIVTIGNGIVDNGDGTYTYTVSQVEDGTVTVNIQACDQAGNTSNPVSFTITVDSTNPQITSYILESDTPRIFSRGITVAELIDINEDYVSEISCTIANGSDVYEWDLDSPIMEDGKYTVSIIVVDMAGNYSEQLVMDIYIDGSAPVPVVFDSVTGIVLTVDTESVIAGSAELCITLEHQTFDIEEPDHFIELTIVDSHGNEVDLLEVATQDASGSFIYTIEDCGDYTLIVNAIDEVGNSTGERVYRFRVVENDVFAEFQNWGRNVSEDGIRKTGVLIAGCVSGVLVVITVVFVKLRKRKK